MLLVNLGCGPNLFPGWLNVDRVSNSHYIQCLRESDSFEGWPSEQRRLGEYLKGGGFIEEAIHDLREPLPTETDSVDAIYLGQVIEHLNPIVEVPPLLSECHRVLKPGAPIRLTTPDIERILSHYVSDTMEVFSAEQPEYYRGATKSMQLSYLLYGATGPDCTRDNYEGHFVCFDIESLSKLLMEAGFQDVAECREPRSSLYEGTVDYGMSHSMALEAVA